MKPKYAVCQFIPDGMGGYQMQNARGILNSSNRSSYWVEDKEAAEKALDAAAMQLRQDYYLIAVIAAAGPRETPIERKKLDV